MLTRRRKRPFNQGSISEIWRLFLQPLVRVYKPHNQSLYEFLEELFDVQHRYITRYKVKSKVEINGLLYVAGWAKVQGLGRRSLPVGAKLWVREDLREPSHVDIEVIVRGRDQDEVFYVERLEWERIKLSCIQLDLDG